MKTYTRIAGFVMVTVVAGAVGLPSVSLAHDEEDTVAITAVEMSEECGAQTVTIKGTATYSESTQHFEVEVDGEVLYHSDDEPESWTVEDVEVDEGSHEVLATIYDKSDLDEVKAQDSHSFSTECKEESSDSGNGGENTDTDCCPGPDEPVVEEKEPQVKGATTKKLAPTLPAKLKPLNSIFRKAFGRNPTQAEWTYWADRLLNDKPQYDALYGAMQWQKLHK